MGTRSHLGIEVRIKHTGRRVPTASAPQQVPPRLSPGTHREEGRFSRRDGRGATICRMGIRTSVAVLLLAVVATSAAPAAPAAPADGFADVVAAAAVPESGGSTSAADDPRYPLWQWPVAGARQVISPYRAPAHDYAAGHRGMDVTATVGAEVMAPADGVVAYRGTVVDRPLLTIEHDGGFVTTFEPLVSTLSPGDAVAEGDVIGTVATGGHADAGTLHLGVRLEGEYMNPMLLFGGLPRAVLLPCCSAT